ncbi:hypothetical protein TNCV_3198201 [Trichonephila clavipes]|nr:hypothetical protein TNCV_3198201 [Trichonephila clavipes]
MNKIGNPPTGLDCPTVSLEVFVAVDDDNEGAIENSRNITARVIERDTSGEIYYFLEDSRGFRTRQRGRQSRQIGR